MSGRVDAQKEVVKERVGEDRCNVQVLCFQSCSVCRFIPVEFPAPLDNMVQCDVTIARGNMYPLLLMHSLIVHMSRKSWSKQGELLGSASSL